MTDITGIVLPKEAVRHLVSFAINELLSSDEHCCKECCGPCSALQQLIDEGLLEKAVWPPTPEDAYDWFDLEAGKVNVGLITARWSSVGCICQEEDEEDEAAPTARAVCMIPDCGCSGYAHP